MPFVFVYGTLRVGEVNDIHAAAERHGIAAPRLVAPGTVRGRLYDFGAYPGYVPDPAGGPVVGDVYEVDDDLLPVLDEIEEVYPGRASLFVRTAQPVAAEGGDAVTCVLYPVGEDAVEALPLIASGDWVAYRRTRDAAGPGQS